LIKKKGTGKMQQELFEIEPEPEYTCQDCRFWGRELIGDGTGMGECLLKIAPHLLKWPGVMACREFEEKK
jgi:hypothetical protein